MRTRFNHAGHHAALFIIAGVLAAGPVHAQQSATPRGSDTTGMGMGRMMGMMGMMQGCPMMVAMTQGPGVALERRKALALTADQVRQLEAVRARETAAERPAMDSMRVLHDRLAPLADAPQFDDAGVRAVFERMGALHADMGVAMLRARHEAREVLTPEQRQKLAAAGTDMKGSMSGMMGGMMGSGGTHCPMMQGMKQGMKQGMMQGMNQGMKQGMMHGMARDSAAAKRPRTPRTGAAPTDHHDQMIGTKPSSTKPSPR